MLRKARIGDVKIIHRMINVSAGKGEMLPRSLMDIYGSLRDFFIYEESDVIGGVCAMNIIWENLAEVRSLYVEENCRPKTGRSLYFGRHHAATVPDLHPDVSKRIFRPSGIQGSRTIQPVRKDLFGLLPVLEIPRLL
jgi:hypothetical protein